MSARHNSTYQALFSSLRRFKNEVVVQAFLCSVLFSPPPPPWSRQEHSEEPFSAGAWLSHGDGDLEPLKAGGLGFLLF